MIMFDLNRNDAEALLRHAENYEPKTGDSREDARLVEALRELQEAILYHLNPQVVQGC